MKYSVEAAVATRGGASFLEITESYGVARRVPAPAPGRALSPEEAAVVRPRLKAIMKARATRPKE